MRIKLKVSYKPKYGSRPFKALECLVRNKTLKAGDDKLPPEARDKLAKLYHGELATRTGSVGWGTYQVNSKGKAVYKKIIEEQTAKNQQAKRRLSF